MRDHSDRWSCEWVFFCACSHFSFKKFWFTCKWGLLQLEMICVCVSVRACVRACVCVLLKPGVYMWTPEYLCLHAPHWLTGMYRNSPSFLLFWLKTLYGLIHCCVDWWGGGFSTGNLIFICSTAHSTYRHTPCIFSTLASCSVCISWDVQWKVSDKASLQPTWLGDNQIQ